MPGVEIDKVLMTTPLPAGLAGFHLDAPQTGEQPDKYAFDVVGWVVGRGARVERVEVWCERHLVRATDVWMRRPDVADHLRRQKGITEAALQVAGISGFHATVSVTGVPTGFALRVEAVLADGMRVPLGVVRGRHEPPRVSYQARFQPLLLSHLARSGSTKLMQLLGEHPDIVVHRRFPFEACIVAHAVRMFQTLAAPCNPSRSADAQALRWGTDSVSALPYYCRHEDPHMHAWLREQRVERFADFAVETVDAFYREVAATQGKSGARYFAEKMFAASHIAGAFANLCPGLKEVFVVRDPRDVVCSRFKFLNRASSNDQATTFDESLETVCLHVAALQSGWKTRSARAHLLLYEDLVQRPEASLRKLLEYLELDSAPPAVKSMVEKTKADTPELQSHQTAGSPLRSIGRWRQDMDATQQATANERLGAVLRDFGYEVGG